MGGICSNSSDINPPAPFADYLKKDEEAEESNNEVDTMSDVFDPSERVRVQAHVRSMDDYRAMYKVGCLFCHMYVKIWEISDLDLTNETSVGVCGEAGRVLGQDRGPVPLADAAQCRQVSGVQLRRQQGKERMERLEYLESNHST